MLARQMQLSSQQQAEPCRPVQANQNLAAKRMKGSPCISRTEHLASSSVKQVIATSQQSAHLCLDMSVTGTLPDVRPDAATLSTY